jgi:signal transduction histidine kinase
MGSAAGVGVYQRMSPAWEIYFAIATAAVMVTVLVDGDFARPRRLGAAAAIVAVALVYAFAGRGMIRGLTGNGRAIMVCGAQSILFAVAVFCCVSSAYLLFALLPMIFMALTFRAAFWFVIAVNLVPVAAGLLTDESVRAVLVYQGSIAVVSAAFALWFCFWVSRVIDQSHERGALIAELEASRAEVARLSHEAGVAAERARLAGEIHDTLAQGFTSIITLLQAVDPALRDERLALAVRTAKENLAESRALVAELSPSALASASLPDAVRRQTRRFTEESAIPAGTRVTGEVRELPTATEVVLLRSTQEALANIRRHSGAREATILLAYAETTVRLVVRDDGHGFDPAVQGFGLRGMRARAEQVAGVLRIKSDPETGTTVELEVPA